MADEQESATPIVLVVADNTVTQRLVGKVEDVEPAEGETLHQVDDTSLVAIGWTLDGDEFKPPVPPDPETPVVTVVSKLAMFRRSTDDEAAKIEAAFNAQPARMRRIFLSAQTFRSDAEEWPLLVEAAEGLFGKDRAAELLAPGE